MSQTQTPSASAAGQWCVDLQNKLMAALDAAWAIAEGSDDPAVIAQARDKARLCGQMAADARKIAALVPQPKPRQLSAMVHEAFDRLDALAAPVVAEAARQHAQDTGKSPAAQALAMQAALAKMKRR